VVVMVVALAGSVTGYFRRKDTKQHSIRRTIDIEEARTSMYRRALIYSEPFLARRYTKVVCN